ncbi:MAG TPA: glycosyltransferase [Polyangia bacterium]|nr:glycosyltransferase [Polyangia bacterium]
MDISGSRGPLALFLPTLDDGGAERVMLQLGAAFSARGRAVDLVVAIPGGPLDSQVPPGPRLVSLDAGRTVAALPALVRYLRRARPAALLATLEHANVLAVAAGAIARTGTRVVLREANVLLPAGELDRRARLLRRLMRAAYRRAGAIVAVSASVADSLARELDIAPGRLRTIYNPVVTPAIAEKAAAALDDPWFAPGAPPVILGVGRLVPQKDFPTLLRAFARVRARRPARLVILGEGADRPALEALARELGVADDVKLPGYDHNPFRYFARAAVFALSSTYEGLPGALIQAMACGCRAISTDCPGGSREILQDGALGPLVPPGDPEALAAGIDRLLEEAQSAPARPRYPLDRFSETGAVDGYLEALEPATA